MEGVGTFFGRVQVIQLLEGKSCLGARPLLLFVWDGGVDVTTWMMGLVVFLWWELRQTLATLWVTLIVLLGLVADLRLCGRAVRKGKTNAATECLVASRKRLAMAWVTWGVLNGVAATVEMRATPVPEMIIVVVL